MVAETVLETEGRERRRLVFPPPLFLSSKETTVLSFFAGADRRRLIFHLWIAGHSIRSNVGLPLFQSKSNGQWNA